MCDFCDAYKIEELKIWLIVSDYHFLELDFLPFFVFLAVRPFFLIGFSFTFLA